MKSYQLKEGSLEHLDQLQKILQKVSPEGIRLNFSEEGEDPLLLSMHLEQLNITIAIDQYLNVNEDNEVLTVTVTDEPEGEVVEP